MSTLDTIWEYAFFQDGVKKKIRLQIGDICSSEEEFDILVCSAFKNDYAATARSLIGALWLQRKISVSALAADPAIDLKEYGCWLSNTIDDNFHRIACVELIDYFNYEPVTPENKFLKQAFSTFCFLLEQASIKGIPLHSVALPILGTGDQEIEECFIIPPLIQQCLRVLKTIPELKTITFFERQESKVINIVDYLNKTLFVKHSIAPDIFISYSSKQTDIAKTVIDYITQAGISCWMAPESIPTGSNYQEEIPLALNQVAALLLLLTPDAETSRWVQKEVGTAIGANKKIYPFQLIPFELNKNFQFLLDGEQIYPAWNKDTEIWLKEAVGKLKNIADEKERER